MGQQIRVNGRLVGQAQDLGRTGQQLPRATPKKALRPREVLEAGRVVREVLDHFFPGHDWLQQAQDGVETFLARCVEQFAGTPRPTNAGPIQAGTDYTHYARSAEEIKETMAAEEGVVSRAPRQVPRYRQAPEEIQIPESELADPLRQERPLLAPSPPSKLPPPPPKPKWAF